MMAASNKKTLSSFLRFASKYRQNFASAAIPSLTAANHAGISIRPAEICRFIHTPSIIGPGQPKDKNETRNQAFETLRRLGVQFTVEDCEAVFKNRLDNAYLSGEEEECGRARIRSAFKFLREEGIAVEERMYSPRLYYMIDRKMVVEFQFLIRALKEEIPDSSPGLGYYEMRLWIRLRDEEKIEEVFQRIIDRWDDLPSLEVDYLEAICMTDQHEYLKKLLDILDTADITKASSLDQLTPIFEFLGRIGLEYRAVKLLKKLKSTARPEHLSHLIFSYATSIEIDEDFPHEVVWTCLRLHTEFEVKPSFEMSEYLIAFESDSARYTKVLVAAKIVEAMSENGLIEKSERGTYFYDTVERIYGADWLKTVEDVISDIGSTKFSLHNFLDYIRRSRYFDVV